MKQKNKLYCNPLDENSTLNMDKGGQGESRKVGGHSYSPKPPNVRLCQREEFEKEFYEGLYSCAECDTEMYDVEDDVWNWHVSEIIKLLDRVEKEIIGKDEEPFGNNDDTIDGMNSLRWEQRKLLNNLREELK